MTHRQKAEMEAVGDRVLDMATIAGLPVPLSPSMLGSWFELQPGAAAIRRVQLPLAQTAIEA